MEECKREHLPRNSLKSSVFSLFCLSLISCGIQHNQTMEGPELMLPPSGEQLPQTLRRTSPHQNFKEELDGVPLLQFLWSTGRIPPSRSSRHGWFVVSSGFRGLGCWFRFFFGFYSWDWFLCCRGGRARLLWISSLKVLDVEKNKAVCLRLCPC